MRNIFLLSLVLLFQHNMAQNPAALQQTENIDFTDVRAAINIYPEQERVTGNVIYKFKALQKTDSLYIDARNMNFQKVLLNGAGASFRNDGNRLWIRGKFSPSAENEIILDYTAEPTQAMYFINWNVTESLDVPRQVWTQGQGKYTSHWLPSFDDMAEKAIFSLSVNFRKGYEVISNGELISKETINDTITRWDYEMKQPMSSYLVAIAAGEYKKEEIVTTSGITISNFYRAGDEDRVEATYRHSREIFDFIESETGVNYPWQNYKQVPVQDFLYSGMENTGATIFSDALMTDPVGFNDQNYVTVNAHELAHQWFGNFVTASNGDHHWLHEGFATYYALLAEREIFGEDHYYWKLFQSAEELKALSDVGKGQALINPAASSLTYYQKGAWALHILQEEIGATAFKAGIKIYLEKYAYGNASTDDFLSEMEKASGKDLKNFKEDWLQQAAFQGTASLNSLKKSAFIRNYMEVAALREIAFKDKAAHLESALNFPVNDYIGQEVVYQLAGSQEPGIAELYNKAFSTGNLYVRQAIAVSMEEIPSTLKRNFEGLLKDDSYITKENALLKLWLNYPDEAARWLEATRGVDGFSNLNVRMLWLVINLVSPQVDQDRTREYFEELEEYTRPYNAFEVRQNAFGYLYQLNAFTIQNLKDLVEAGRHHNSRFREYSRKLLETLLKDPDYREKYVALSGELSPKDREFLNSRMN